MHAHPNEMMDPHKARILNIFSEMQITGIQLWQDPVAKVENGVHDKISAIVNKLYFSEKWLFLVELHELASQVEPIGVDALHELMEKYIIDNDVNVDDSSRAALVERSEAENFNISDFDTIAHDVFEHYFSCYNHFIEHIPDIARTYQKGIKMLCETDQEIDFVRAQQALFAIHEMFKDYTNTAITNITREYKLEENDISVMKKLIGNLFKIRELYGTNADFETNDYLKNVTLLNELEDQVTMKLKEFLELLKKGKLNATETKLALYNMNINIAQGLYALHDHLNDDLAYQKYCIDYSFELIHTYHSGVRVLYATNRNEVDVDKVKPSLLVIHDMLKNNIRTTISSINSEVKLDESDAKKINVLIENIFKIRELYEASKHGEYKKEYLKRLITLNEIEDSVAVIVKKNLRLLKDNVNAMETKIILYNMNNEIAQCLKSADKETHSGPLLGIFSKLHSQIKRVSTFIDAYQTDLKQQIAKLRSAIPDSPTRLSENSISYLEEPESSESSNNFLRK